MYRLPVCNTDNLGAYRGMMPLASHGQTLYRAMMPSARHGQMLNVMTQRHYVHPLSPADSGSNHAVINMNGPSASLVTVVIVFAWCTSVIF